MRTRLKKYLTDSKFDLTEKQIDDCIQYSICFVNEYPKYEGKESPKDYDIDRNTDFVGDMSDFFGNIYNNPYDSSIQTLIDDLYRIMYYGEVEPEDF